MRSRQLPLESDWARQFVFDEAVNAVAGAGVPFEGAATPEPPARFAHADAAQLAPRPRASTTRSAPVRDSAKVACGFAPRRPNARYHLRNGLAAIALLALSIRFPELGIILLLVAAVFIANAWRHVRAYRRLNRIRKGLCE